MSTIDLQVKTRRAVGTSIGLVMAVVVALLAAVVVAPQVAFAGTGSLVNGVVWADTNRDGARGTSEPLRAGVTVQLLSSPGGAVVATTTTSAAGAYSFANIADGSYVVRVDAPGAFRFPDAVSGANDFVRPGPPNPGDPERGVSAPFTITGATRVTGLDAGLQPIATLSVAQLNLENACEGLAQTGTPPFDSAEGPGLDTGTANCIVRTGDTVRQQFGVSLTGLPGNTVIPNVVLEMTVSSPDGAAVEMIGTGPGGAPAACLTSAVGANPSSSTRRNTDGSITIICNLGPMSSSVTVLDVGYRVTNASAVPSHATITAHAYAAQGDAGVSNTVSGPTVEVTGAAEWDLQKAHYIAPTPTTEIIDGEQVFGFYTDYRFTIRNTATTGGGPLEWPITFTERLTQFPNAIITQCRPTNLSDNPAVRSPWTLTCPLREAAGDDGWQVSIAPNNDAAVTGGIGFMVMRIFIPQADVYRSVDPDWQPGDDRPIGVSAWENHAEDTDGWAMRGGQLNYGTGFEPGWDGTNTTGNNLTTHSLNITEPRWDLAKSAATNPAFVTRTIGGEEVQGYEVWYNLNVSETNGAILADYIDDITFRDVLTSHPNAHLLECRTNPSVTNYGTTTCDTGQQPADGWEFHFVPNQAGINQRRALMQARFFIPADAIAPDPCAASPTDTLRIRNEARDTDGWTAGGDPINTTGLEPGWDGTTATGNNVVDRTWTIRSTVSDCGTYSGNKVWTFNPTLAWAGRQMGTQVAASASNDRVSIPDLTVCDVFDVSVLHLAANAYGAGRHTRIVSTGTINQADFVIEYAQGPNETRTQAPTDFTSIQNAARDCHEHDGPWETDPTAFGANWQDTVNMIRVRPIDPDHVQTGPFLLQLETQLITRGFYNGGPNAGEPIPTNVMVTNVGGWTTRGNPDVLSTATRQVPFRGMVLAIGKAPVQAQYLPGNTAVWNLSVAIDQASIGATMRNVRVVDTLPPDLAYDAACTQSRLPAGVTATYDPVAHVVTFRFGDVLIETAPRQWVAGGGGKPVLQLCTTVPTLAQPGDRHRNNVQVFGDNSENAPTATAQIQITGSGQMGITKSVNKPMVASGEEYQWSLEWGNTSTTVAFRAPDVIDVLPWNGDGDAGSGSQRTQLASDYDGLAQLTGPLAAPQYTSGGTGVGTDVPGTWYYSTAAPATLNHDPRNAANADPAAAGGLWLTAAEVSDFGDVTAVRFVSSAALTVQSRVRAIIPAVSTSNALDNVYVNRAMITSATVPDQPLLSNEPYVLMPGFILGDLVWIDTNGNGRLDAGEFGVPGVTVEVRNADGEVVATETTNAEGRWAATGLFPGDYTVHIPAQMFAPGAPLAGTVVRTFGSSDANDVNESGDNNNTATADPAISGLTSSPVTLAYVRNADGILTGGNGPAGDDVANLGSDLLPDSFTNFTVDLALMPAPGIDIEKATNQQDADTPTGPYVTVGGGVRWTYVVTNTGGVPLTEVTVTDDMVDAADIDCDGTGSNVIAGPLALEASFTCVATGTATAGQYANMGTVTALDPARSEVTDEDPSHFFGATPDVDIEKATNGQDADDPSGPLVTVGGQVRWTYVVTNTGNVPLANVTVVDDMVDTADIDCDGTGSNVIAGPLAPEASFTCVATGTATAGQYANMATVTGTAPQTTDVDGNTIAGAVVDDQDASHHFGIQPAVDIEKATNGQDADEPTGPLLAAGSEVRWTYVVTNTGNVPLTVVTVSDDLVDAADIDCDGTGSNVVPGPLAAGASFTCVATGTAIEGQYANTGTVTGVGPATTDVDGNVVAGVVVTDEDRSHYFGAIPDVDVEKATNGQDADVPTGPNVTVGGAVQWTYRVTNTGNVDLVDVTVTDDLIDSADIDCEGTGSNIIAGPLAAGGSFTCVATGTATAGQYANLGAVTGIGPQTTDVDGNPVVGVTVDDRDPSHHFGIQPAIDIEKATNSQDADTPTGPVVNLDGAVRWTYVVTNIGNVPLTDVTVVDDLVDAGGIDCDETGSNVIAGPLAAGGSFTCVASGVAVVGQYANLGSVTGTAPQTTDVDGNTVPGVVVVDDDPSHYLGVDASVDIEKATNGQDADEPTGPNVTVGGDVRWTYVVTNTGTTELTDVTVTDNLVDAADIDCEGTGSNVIAGPLAAGASFTCVATGTAIEGQYANLGTVTGVGPETTGVDGNVVAGVVVTDEDRSHYFGVVSAVDVEKATNGQDADEPTGPNVTVGDQVQWTYVVTNTGNSELTDVTVTDNLIDAADIDCEGTGSNVIAGPLAAGESFTCVATGTATAGQYGNLATVTGIGPATTDVDGNQVTGVVVTDTDPSHYLGTPTPVDEPPVDERPPPVDSLPRTGAAIGMLLTAAGTLLLGGGLLVILLARRRKPARRIDHS